MLLVLYATIFAACNIFCQNANNITNSISVGFLVLDMAKVFYFDALLDRNLFKAKMLANL